MCFGHGLDLAIVNSMKDESRVNRVFYAGSRCHHFRWKRKCKLESTKLEFGLQTPSAVSDYPTRWGSKEKMARVYTSVIFRQVKHL